MTFVCLSHYYTDSDTDSTSWEQGSNPLFDNHESYVLSTELTCPPPYVMTKKKKSVSTDKT